MPEPPTSGRNRWRREYAALLGYLRPDGGWNLGDWDDRAPLGVPEAMKAFLFVLFACLACGAIGYQSGLYVATKAAEPVFRTVKIPLENGNLLVVTMSAPCRDSSVSASEIVPITQEKP